jgi:hypothetical protein
LVIVLACANKLEAQRQDRKAILIADFGFIFIVAHVFVSERVSEPGFGTVLTLGSLSKYGTILSSGSLLKHDLDPDA